MAERDGVPLLHLDHAKSAVATTTSGAMNTPPFEPEYALFSSINPEKADLHLPAIYTAHDKKGSQRGLKPIDLTDAFSIRSYFAQHLSVARLNVIHKHLWVAGLPRHAQPLHQHVLRKRGIVLTELADHHLLWRDDDLLIMPLPAYLLDHDMWTQHICTDDSLFRLANGMFLSYIWLICSETDFHIAHDNNLLPKDIEWKDWTALVRSVIPNLPVDASKDVNPRYLYGELRLARINWIYRFCGQTRNFTTLLRGYSYGYTSYGSFLQRNTAWIIVSTVYITIVLTAMQVGLGTKELGDDLAFSRASYGLTILAIVAPIGAFTLVVVLLTILIPFNLSYALKQRKKTARSDRLVPELSHR